MAPKKKYSRRQNAAQEQAAAAKKEEAAVEKEEEADSGKENGRNRASIFTWNSPIVMDPKIWGTLQNHIDLLEDVYCRLPFNDFFELRTVCKAWYGVACKRMALKEPLHKPFFTLHARNGSCFRLDGILTFNKVYSCKPERTFCYNAPTLGMPSPSLEYQPNWAWKSWDDSRDSVPSYNQFVAEEGLVCRLYPYIHRDLHHQVMVYDWNLPDEKGRSPRGNARRRSVERVPDYGPEQTVVGMMVLQREQNEKRPFKIVLGSPVRDTQVFDSMNSSWVTKPCRPYVRGGLHQTTGCASCNGRVYITMEHTREILVYDFGEASWSSIDAPGGSAQSPLSMLPLRYCNDTLGSWDGRILDVVDDVNSSSLLLWELVDGTEQEWRVFDRMPTDLYRWFRSSGDAEIAVYGSFCGDYLLAYSYSFLRNEVANMYCLYNIATKVWQRLDIHISDFFFDRLQRELSYRSGVRLYH
ncbi:hypothetical protein M758_10G050100 [Ceratodon purpureus]|nr:hypothetical protein M758_10G050100 [Ceratodon purpureus]